MKCFILAALAGAALLSGCASDAAKPAGQQVAAAERSETSLGSYIARKSSNSNDNVKQVDKQAFENDRLQNTGLKNGPGGQ